MCEQRWAHVYVCPDGESVVCAIENLICVRLTQYNNRHVSGWHNILNLNFTTQCVLNPP